MAINRLDEPASPTGVLSPHFDDAVLSCAQILAANPGSTVLTVFSGGPPSIDILTSWNAACGFALGDDVMGIRTAEDDAALATLGARGIRLGLWERQYRWGQPDVSRTLATRLRYLRQQYRRESGLVAEGAEKLRTAIAATDLTTWLMPLGVTHPDHRLTRQICLRVARELPDRQWLVYEELPYSAEHGNARRRALAAIKRAGFQLQPAPYEPDADQDRKRAALAHYASQLKALGQRAEFSISTPERYHVLLSAVSEHMR